MVPKYRCPDGRTMAEKPEMADYADMQQTMERMNQIDILDGRTCPHTGCAGTVVRQDDGVVCGDCGRWLVRLY